MQKAINQAVCFGEILWDVLPSGEKPGGAPMNVAYHLHKLGMQPAVITRVGTDAYGKRLIALLQEQGVSTAFVQQDAEHPTGVVNATIGAHNEVTYDIVYPVAWDFIQADAQHATMVQQAQFLVFGSLATRNAVSKNTLLGLLDAAKVKVLDINLRPPHFSQSSVEELLNKASILKLNEHELALIAGWYKMLDGEEDQLKLLQDRFKLNTIVVTKGGDGAVLIERGSLYRHDGYKVKVADTVGSGDAFLAGFLHKRAVGSAPDEALQFANGLGAFIATQHGACPPYDMEQVQNLIRESHPLPAS